MLSICHTVISTLDPDGTTSYAASSPDEYALVNFCKFAGVEFMELDEADMINIKFNSQIYKFKLLYIFEFDSNRKRQSVLVRNSKNEIYLYCKGADSVIEKRINKDYRKINMDELITQLESFGSIGLRTLMLAQRRIPEEEFL